MTAIWVPEGIEVSSLVSSLASKGVQIAGGILDGLAGKYFRIG
jgi:alanine-glyoxylate transaminase/serine-glyoxylate transaminase/serine-pyruvate transaminase